MIGLKQFFEDKTGKLSMMRLGFYTIVLNACCLSYLYPNQDVLILGMFAVASGLKWVQKREEK